MMIIPVSFVVGRDIPSFVSSFYSIMIIIVVIINLLSSFSSLHGLVVSAAVTNDECINAQPITIGGPTIQVNTFNATIDTNVLNDCLSNRPPSYPGVWFTFIGTGERLVARSCIPSLSTRAISIYKGNCTPSSQLQCVVATYYPCQRERFIFDTIQGIKYHVLVQTNYKVVTDLSIFVSPIVNDFCTNALPITIDGPTLQVNTTYATRESTTLTDCITKRPNVILNPGIWFNFTGTGQRLVARSCNPRIYPYTQISIYKGNCALLQCVAATMDACSSERFIFDTVQGTMYHVLIIVLAGTYEGLLDFSLFSIEADNNDACINARPLDFGSSVTINTTYITADINPCRIRSGGDYFGVIVGVWYNVTGTGDFLVFNICNLRSRSLYDITIFKGSCRDTLSSRNCIDNRYDFTSTGACLPIYVETIQGANYHVLVETTDEQSMNFNIDTISPVSNDKCQTSQFLTLGSPVKTDFLLATSDVNVLNDCINGKPPTYPGIWFNFTGTGERLVARSCEPESTYGRLIISIYTGNCDPSQLQCVAGTNNPCQRERFIFDTVQGTKYHVLVQNPISGKSDDLLIFVPPSINDFCTTAQPITIGSTVTTNTTYATTDKSVSNDCIFNRPPSYPGVWYNFTGTGDRIVVRSCGQIYISIYKGDCAPSQLQCVAGTNTPCIRERFTFDTIKGTTYHVLFQNLISDEIANFSIFVSPIMNDLCTTAQPFTIGSSVTMNTTYATTDKNVVNNCLDGTSPDYPGIWFNFTGTGERLVARSCNNYGRNSISIYKGDCAPSQLQCVAGTNTPCERERFTFDTVQGTIYHVLVQTPYFDETTDLSIFVSPILNDLCTTAQPFTIGSSVTTNTTYATTDKNVVNNCVDGTLPDYPGVWFNFTGTGERLVARSCNNYGRNSISIYKGDCAPSQLQCVAGTNNPCQRERFTFDTVQGTIYHVLVQTPYFDETTDLSIFVSPIMNDYCTTAQPFMIGSSVTTNTTYATTDKNVVNNCVDGTAPDFQGIWFNFTGTGERLVIRSCFPYIGYRSISIYKGDCAPSQLQCVAGTTNPCGRLAFNSVNGTKYHVLVQSSNDDVVDLAIFNKSIVDNDYCVNASKITLGVPIDVDIRYALSDEQDVNDNCTGISSLLDPGVWYTFNGTGESVEVDPCRNLTFSSRVFASVYDGGCDKSLLTCVAVGRIDCGRNRLIFPTEKGIVYYILLQASTSLAESFPLIVLPTKVPTNAPAKISTKQPSSGNSPTRISVTPRPVPPPSLLCPARIGNGELRLGIDCDGHLIDYVGGVGLQFNTQMGSFEALAKGSVQLEGWGVSATNFLLGTSFAGYAVSENGGTSFAQVISFSSNGVEAVSVILIQSEGLQVTHQYKPSPYTSSLYECTVTFKNVGSSILSDLRYRRTMNWDSDDVSTCIDIVGGSSRDVEYVTNQAVRVPDPRNISLARGPNVTSMFLNCQYGQSPCPVVDYGPIDQGVDFIFYLNETDGITPRVLLSGESTTIKIYFGATVGKSRAMNALQAVPSSGMIKTYSLSYSSNNVAKKCDSTTEPVTFILGFSPTLVPFSPIGAPATVPTSLPSASPYDSETLLIALTQIVETKSADIGKFLDNNGVAVNEAHYIINEIRSTLVDLTVKGLAISQSLTDKDILLFLTTPPIDTFDENRTNQFRNLIDGLSVCDILIYDMILNIIQLLFSLFKIKGSVTAGPLLAQGVAYAIAEKWLSGKFKTKLIQLISLDPVYLSTPMQIGRLAFEIISGFGFAQLLKVLKDEVAKLSLADRVVLSASIFVNLAAMAVPPVAALVTAARFVEAGTLIYVIRTNIIDVRKFCVEIPPTPAPLLTLRPALAAPTRRPIVISTPPPRRVGTGRGEPHIVTLDGFSFDCQARGEFTLIKSFNSTLHIQGRFVKLLSSSSNIDGSVTSGIVIRTESITNDPIIQISIESGTANSIRTCFNFIKLYQGGVVRPLNSSNSSLTSTISITIVGDDEIVLLYNDTGLEIHLFVRYSSSFGCFFTYWMAIPKTSDTLTGLLGNGNGNPYDDWQTKNGIILPTPSNTSAIYQGGYDYCRTQWCIRNEKDSLFTYGGSNGDSYTSYYDCDAPYKSGLEAAVASVSNEVRNVCGSNIECIIDGVVGTVADAQSLLNDIIRIDKVLMDFNITYSFNETMIVTAAPSTAPTPDDCGLFDANIFCPFTFRGILGRLFRRIFGFLKL